jgi:predicted amidohydrolase YtcJ
MTAAADLVLKGGAVHTLSESGSDADSRSESTSGAVDSHEAVAVRDGRIVRLGSDYEMQFLQGVETEVIDLDGRTLLPGFADAHTHLDITGRYRVHADLRGADGPEAVAERLRERAGATPDGEWVLGFGYDDAGWDVDVDESEDGGLTHERLDGVDDERPVVAFREDLHSAVVNTAVLDRLDVPGEDVRAGGRLAESALDPVRRAIAPDRAATRDLLLAAQAVAHERGITAVHDMVRESRAPGVYRDLALAGDLGIRVRLNYWATHLDALKEAGLRTNAGGNLVRTGAIKVMADGSIGSRTAKLAVPYADRERAGGGDGDGSGDATGEWVTPPEELRAVVERADDLGYQVAAHAIGDAAVEAVLDAFAACEAPGERRHRIEHAELATDEHLDRMADLGVVASMQPNFLKWAGPAGLYETRLGAERRERSNRFPASLERGVPLAFGSDGMPLDPLVGVHHAVNAPAAKQALSVTEALRAYTRGGAYAGFDEERLGTLEPGACADLVVLERSPWKHPTEIRDIDVAMTVVDGEVVYDAR